MSDMYLELRSRIPVVAAKTAVGTRRLQEAQDATGLSNESIARLIPVSEKTWRRWKEAGEIPTAALPAVAKALSLEIRGAQVAPLDYGGDVTLHRNGEGVPPSLEVRLEGLAAGVAELLREQAGLKQEIVALRGEIQRAQPSPPKQRKPA